MRYLILFVLLLSTTAAFAQVLHKKQQQPFSSDFGASPDFGANPRPQGFIQPRTTGSCPTGNPKSEQQLLNEFQTCAAQGLPQGCIVPQDVQDLICSIQSLAPSSMPPVASSTTYGITKCDNITIACPAGIMGTLNTANVFNVKTTYQAKGDGVTDDSGAIAAAFAACAAAGGGEVLFPPTGSGYVIKHANLITVQNTGPCFWYANSGHYWPANFYDNTASDWMAKGAWIWCQDTTYSCAELSAPGQAVIGLNWWYTQPTPSSATCSTTPCAFDTSWTPTTYPATITADATTNFYKIRDNMIVNAYQCLDIEGPASGVANMYSDISDNYMGCFFKDVKFNRVDNTIVWDRNHEFLLWYQGSKQVFGYVEGGAGGLGWDVNYLANIQVSNSEIVWKRLGILLTDQTVTNGFGGLTFAGANWQVHGLQFNEVCRAMAVASSTTHFNGGPAGNAVGVNIFDNILAAVDTTTSGTPGGGSPQCAAATPNLFDLGSDNVSVIFNGLNIGFANTIINIGAGNSGFVEVLAPRVQKYSAYTANLPAFNAGTNAILDLIGDQFSVTPASGAGPYTSGGFVQPVSLNAVAVNGPAGTQRQLSFGSNPQNPTSADFGSSYRWIMRSDASTESGSNAGSNFIIDRYNDSGTYIDSPLVINRATGVINYNDMFSLNQLTVGTLPSCGAPQTGWISMVTDEANSPTWLSTATAGGSTRALVMCDGNGHWQVR